MKKKKLVMLAIAKQTGKQYRQIATAQCTNTCMRANTYTHTFAHGDSQCVDIVRFLRLWTLYCTLTIETD